MPLPNVYGVGLGWGLPAMFKDGTKDGSTGRMDGYGIYLKRAATSILGNVLRGLGGDDALAFGKGNKDWNDRQAALIKKFGEKALERRSTLAEEAPSTPSSSSTVRSPTNKAATPSSTKSPTNKAVFAEEKKEGSPKARALAGPSVERVGTPVSSNRKKAHSAAVADSSVPRPAKVTKVLTEDQQKEIFKRLSKASEKQDDKQDSASAATTTTKKKSFKSDADLIKSVNRLATVVKREVRSGEKTRYEKLTRPPPPPMLTSQSSPSSQLASLVAEGLTRPRRKLWQGQQEFGGKESEEEGQVEEDERCRQQKDNASEARERGSTAYRGRT